VTDITITQSILAVVSCKPERVGNCAVPVFMAQSTDEVQELASTLAKILDAMAHELEPETMIVVRHA
jgi:hypothetical protein